MNSFLLFMAAVVGMIIFMEISQTPTTPASSKEKISINSLAFSKKKNVAAVGTEDGRIILWDASLNDERYELDAHKTTIENLMFSRDGSWLLSTDTDGMVILWSTRTGELVKKLRKLNENGFPTKIKEFIDIDADCRCLIFELKTDSVVYYNYKTETMSKEQPIL